MDARSVRPRGGVPQRLRGEGTRHAGVEERRRRPGAPRRTQCVPKLQVPPPTVRVVLVVSARKARAERTPAS